MKKATKIYFSLAAFLLLAFALTAQVPDRFNFQGVAKYNDAPLTDSTIAIFFIQNVAGTELYEEKQKIKPDKQGVFSCHVGGGDPQNGKKWSDIDWGNGERYLRVEIEYGNGTYKLGTQQLVSVPFALVAQKSMTDKDEQTLSLAGNTLKISGSNSVNLPVQSDDQTLSINGNTLSISDGNTVNLPIQPDNDKQTLDLSGNSLSISGGNTVNLPVSPDKDNQLLSLNGNTLQISGGNSVNLPAQPASLWNQSSNNIYNATTGNVGIGIGSPSTKLHVNGTGRFDGTLNINEANATLTFSNGNGVAQSRLWMPNGQKYIQFDNLNGSWGGTDPSGGFVFNGTFYEFGGGGPLKVNGTSANASASYYYFHNIGNAPPNNVGSYSGLSKYSILAAGAVRGSEFQAVSDARIKTVIAHSDGVSDLSTLALLKVTDYTHKDIVAKGIASKKGFIAQEVEQVFGEAVSRGTDFIPDIYQVATAVVFDKTSKNLSISLEKTPELAVGDRVRLMADKEYELEVVAVADNTFTVKNWEADSPQVFVFGKEVHDFRTVDYDRIFTLNVSATQELARQFAELKNENARLLQKQENIEARFNQLESKLNTASGPANGVGFSNK